MIHAVLGYSGRASSAGPGLKPENIAGGGGILGIGKPGRDVA